MNTFFLRHMKNTQKKSPQYKLFLFSYIIIFLIPIVVTTFGYAYSYRTIQNDAILYHTTLLNQGKLVYDQIFKKINSDIKILASNSLAYSLAQKEDWSSEDLFTVVELRDDLSSLRQNDNYIDTVGIYFHKNKCFVTNRTRYAEKVSDFYLNDHLKLSLEDFIRKTDQAEGYFLIHDGNSMKLLYYRNAYYSNFRNKIATAYLLISCDTMFQEGFSSLALFENSGFFIISDQDQVLWNSNPEISIDKIGNSFLSNSLAMKYIKLNRTNYLIGSIKSEFFDGQYVIYTPKKIFFQDINYLKYIISVEMFLSIGLGLFLSYYFTRKNYGPIEKMISLINARKVNRMDEAATSSYNNLETALRELLEDNHNLSKLLQHSNSKVQEGILVCFLKGLYIHEQKVCEFLNDTVKMSEISSFRIVLFSFKDIESHSLFIKEDRISEAYDLLVFSVKNVIGEILLEQSGKGIVLEVDNMVACILPLAMQQDTDFYHKVQKCISFFKDVFCLEAFASVSSEYRHWTDLSAAYEEAFMAKAHKTFWGNEVNDIVVYIDDSMQEPEEHHNNLLLDQQRQLSNLIFAKKYQEVPELLNEILDGCFSKDVRYMPYNQCHAFSIISIILDNLNTMERNEDQKEKALNANLRYYERLLNTKSVKALKAEINAIITEIMEAQQQKHSDEPEWLNKVKEYVKRNYRNPDINITHIANKLSLSVSYLGGTFKRIEGMSILDYIHLLRIEESKKLLVQDKTIKFCAESIGYTDVKTFIRAFKRYEGITPGQYRTKLQSLDDIPSV